MFSDLRVRFRTLFRRTAVTQEIDQELQFHLQQQMEKYLQAGFTREQARHRVRSEFGGFTQIKEDCWEARGVNFVEHIGQDVRYAMRMFGRTPGFTLVVVMTLALGIGANTAVFSLINAVLLKMLPVKDPERLVKFSKVQPVNGPNDYFSYPEVERFQRELQAFSAVFAFANLGGVNVEAKGPRRDRYWAGRFRQLLFHSRSFRHPRAHHRSSGRSTSRGEFCSRHQLQILARAPGR